MAHGLRHETLNPVTPRARCIAALKRSGVCAILDDGVVSMTALICLAGSLAGGGIEVFQLRAKRTRDREFLAAARKLVKILRGRFLVVNDRADIARLSGAAGVHLGTEDMGATDARRLLGEGRVLGLSAGNGLELRDALATTADYVSLGPVCRTPTKADAGVPLGRRRLKLLASGIHGGKVRLAVGGITPHNVGKLADSGIEAVAVSSALICDRDPAKAARRMLAAVAVMKEASRGKTFRRIGGR